MKKYLHSILLSLAFVLYTQSVYAFDCSKAKNYPEISICADQLLFRLDLAMNENFKFMLNSNIGDGARKDLKSTQRAWVSERNKCQDKACILNSYKKRLDEMCEYPVVDGVHPICISFDQVISENDQDSLRVKDVDRLLCDFKNTTPEFYNFSNGVMRKTEDIGIEKLIPIYNKFVGLKLVEFKRDTYLSGYFLSIHDVTEKIAPNPIGDSYVKRSQVVCLSLQQLL